MNRQSVTWLAIIVGISLLMLTWYSDNRQSQSKPGNQRIHDLSPDFMMSHFHTEEFDSGGRIKVSIEAHGLKHYTSQDTTLLDAPRIQYFGNRQAPWLASSQQGMIENQGDLFTLSNQVELVRQPSQHSDRITLKTERLRMQLDKEVAETDMPVRIESPSGYLSALGMVADLKENHIRLQNEVRGEHAPIQTFQQ